MKSDNRHLVFSLMLLTAAMIFLVFASVPIYNIFCKATGFGGTIREAIPQNFRKNLLGKKEILIKFDSNIEQGLNLKFFPEQKEILIKTGENVIIFYKIVNPNNYDIYATSVYNVTPIKTAKYFYKIECFCFQEQLIKAGETRILPVSFFIDPEIEDDKFASQVKEITLSYIFYRINNKIK